MYMFLNIVCLAGAAHFCNITDKNILFMTFTIVVNLGAILDAIERKDE